MEYIIVQNILLYRLYNSAAAAVFDFTNIAVP